MMENKKYVVVVHDRRDGTYAYRGEGSKRECVRDVNVLVEGKRIPPRKIEVLPVKGEPRNTEPARPVPAENTTSVIIASVITTAAVITGGYLTWRYWKKQRRKILSGK